VPWSPAASSFTAVMNERTDAISVALWRDPVTRHLSESLGAPDAAYPVSVHDAGTDTVGRMLLSGEVDAALLPSPHVLSHTADYDILPAVAVSSRSNPYASISVAAFAGGETLDIIVNEGRETDALLAEIILREQYGRRVRRVPESDASGPARISIHETLRATEDAHELDLGREWFEMITYPFVWGLFVTRRDSCSPYIIRRIRDAVLDAELRKRSWMSTSKFLPVEKVFYGDSLGYRLDTLAIASLTELCEFLYYYGEVDELPQFVLASYDADDEES